MDIKSSPKYIGALSTKLINALPRPQEGEYVLNTDTQKILTFKNNNWIEYQQSDKGIQISLYELNQSIVPSLPNIKDFSDKIELLNEFYKRSNNTFYMLYGKDISYFTIFQKSNNKQYENFGVNVIECLQNISKDIKSIVEQDNNAIEIWVMVDNIATCLYLFPYDQGLVSFKG